jgi:hypothetical protein
LVASISCSASATVSSRSDEVGPKWTYAAAARGVVLSAQADRRAMTSCWVISSMAAAWVLLQVIARTQLVLVSVLVALLLSALLQPIAAALVERGMPRPLASALVMVGGLWAHDGHERHRGTEKRERVGGASKKTWGQ